MQLVFVVRRHFADGTGGYVRAVERAYSRVPAVGEMVMLDDDGDIGHVIEQVSWDNDGKAVLRFTDPAVSEEWLLAAGFDLVYSG